MKLESVNTQNNVLNQDEPAFWKKYQQFLKTKDDPEYEEDIRIRKVTKLNKLKEVGAQIIGNAQKPTRPFRIDRINKCFNEFQLTMKPQARQQTKQAQGQKSGQSLLQFSSKNYKSKTPEPPTLGQTKIGSSVNSTAFLDSTVSGFFDIKGKMNTFVNETLEADSILKAPSTNPSDVTYTSLRGQRKSNSQFFVKNNAIRLQNINNIKFTQFHQEEIEKLSTKMREQKLRQKKNVTVQEINSARIPFVNNFEEQSNPLSHRIRSNILGNIESQPQIKPNKELKIALSQRDLKMNAEVFRQSALRLKMEELHLKTERFYEVNKNYKNNNRTMVRIKSSQSYRHDKPITSLDSENIDQSEKVFETLQNMDSRLGSLMKAVLKNN